MCLASRELLPMSEIAALILRRSRDQREFSCTRVSLSHSAHLSRSIYLFFFSLPRERARGIGKVRLVALQIFHSARRDRFLDLSYLRELA